MQGLGYGWVAPALHQLMNSNSERSLTAEECSWIASIASIIRPLGPVFLTRLMDKLGRKRIFLIVAIINFFTWIAILFAKTAMVFYIIRSAFGIAVGLNESTTSIYLGENCAPRFRGRFNSSVIFLMYIGQLTAYVLVAYLSYETVAIVHAGFGFSTLLSIYLVKETPQWLIMKGNFELAKKHYDWLRDTKHTNAGAEFEETRQHLMSEKSTESSFAELYRQPEVRKSLRLVMSMTVLSVSTGFAAISSFATMTFINTDSFTVDQFTIIFGALQLITCGISSFFMDMVNRRTLFLIGCLIIAIVQAATAALYYIQDVPYFAWLVFIFISIYSCTFGMLIRPLSSTIRGELLPQSVKAVGSSMTVAANGVANFITIKLYLPIADAYGMHINFVIYFLASLLLFTHMNYELLETKHMTLVDIQKALKESSRGTSKPLKSRLII